MNFSIVAFMWLFLLTGTVSDRRVRVESVVDGPHVDPDKRHQVQRQVAFFISRK